MSTGLKGEKTEDKTQRKPLTNSWNHERKGFSEKFKVFAIVDTYTVPGPVMLVNINVTGHDKCVLMIYSL